MQWLKDHAAQIGVTLICVLTAAATAGVIWFYATHTCIAWEDVPTGRKCIDWRTETYTTLGIP